jgi:hypothetical protein
MKGQWTVVYCTYCQALIHRPFGRTVCRSCEARMIDEPDDLGNPGIDDLDDIDPQDIIRDLTAQLRKEDAR